MKTKLFSSKLLVAVLFSPALLFALTAIAQTDSGATRNNNIATQNNETKITLALRDLAVIYGEPVETVVEAKKICDIEKFLSDCAEIGKRYALFSPEEEKKVDAVLEGIKSTVVNDLKQCATDECLIKVAKKLSVEVSRKNPTLAAELDLTNKKVSEVEKITTASRDVGIGFKICREMDPDNAPIDTLRLCAKLIKNQTVQKFVSTEAKNNADNLDKITNLRVALSAGDFQCGDNTPESCGNFCLNANADNRSGSSDAIPPVCRQIAQRFFGEEGVKQLENKYKIVSEATDFYQKKADNVSFTTLEGKILTSPEAIGAYMEEQGRLGNVPAVGKGMDFMVVHGFVSPDEKDFALKMVKNIGDKGGIQGFDICQSDPSKCQQYIPQDQIKQFQAARQIQDTISKESGIDLSLCKGTTLDAVTRDQCLAAAKRALPELDALSIQSTEARNFINDIRNNLNQNQTVKNLGDNLATSNGGPGGCRSTDECSKYCSDPTHGPECIAFGAKSQVFRGSEATSRFQEFQNQTQTFNPSFSQPDFSQPQNNQFQNNRQQTANFTGPSRECLQSIQSGDFEKARVACASSVPSVAPLPVPSVQDNTSTTTVVPITVTPEQGCARAGGTWSFADNFCHMPNQINNTSEAMIRGCNSAGGTWTGSYCKMPNDQSTTPMDPAKGCVSAGGTWSTAENYCHMPNDRTNNTTDAMIKGCVSSGGIWSASRNFCDMPNQPMDPAKGCTAAGGTWNTATYFCQMSNVTATTDYAAACATAGGTWSTTTHLCAMQNASSQNGSQACPSGQYWYVSPGSTVGSCYLNSVNPNSPNGCSSGQYWNGNACVTSTQPNINANCSANQYWNGNACVNSSSPGSCPFGQYWYSPPSGGSGYCKDSAYSSDPATACGQTGGTWNTSTHFCQMPNMVNPVTACVTAGGTWNASTGTGYCQMPAGTGNQGQACPSMQYWNGTACVATNMNMNNSCPSNQYWNGSTCMSNPVQANSSTCSSSQYWNGSACVTSTQPTSNTCSSGQYWNGSACVSSTPAYTDPSAGCASAGGSWNGSSCVMPNNTTPGSGSYTPPAGDSGSYTPPSGGGSYTPPTEGSMSPMPMQSPTARRNSQSLTANALSAIDWLFESIFGSPK